MKPRTRRIERAADWVTRHPVICIYIFLALAYVVAYWWDKLILGVTW